MNQFLILLSLFLVVFAGYFSYKISLFQQEAVKYLNRFVFYISAPAVIFSSIATLDKSKLSSYPFFLLVNIFSLCMLFLLIFFLSKLTKAPREIRGSILYTAGASNVVFFGFPILLALFPKEHFALGVIYLIAAITIGDLTALFLLGIDKHNGPFNLKKNLTEFMKNPIVISSILGFIVLLFDIPISDSINSSLEILGKPIITLGLFSMGIYFGHHLNFKKIGLSLIPSAISLLIFPFMVYLLTFYFLKLDIAAAQTSVVMASMPSAAFSIVVADIYDLDKTLTSNTVLLSSLLCLFTSPFWIWLITK
jgi:predicted permease